MFTAPVLVESDMFMDALSAATTTKKEASRKRKRGISLTSTTTTSKDAPTTPDIVKPSSDKLVLTATKETEASSSIKQAPTKVEVAAPLKFYQDTLGSDSEAKDEEKSNEDVEMRSVDDEVSVKADDKKDLKDISIETKGDDEDDDDEDDKPLKRLIKDVNVKSETTTDLKGDSAELTDVKIDAEILIPERKPPGPGCGENGPPSVLITIRRKGPKKQLKWRPQDSLEDIRYFELDENERVNVTKTFVDMKQMERTNEREGFLKARKLNAEDTMVEQIPWAELFIVDDVPAHPDGVNSKERQIQADRELTCLKALYFNLLMIPDSPAEPDMEQYKITDPQIIPLNDTTGNIEAVTNLTHMLWPESRGSPPHKSQALIDDGSLPFPNAFGQYPPFQNGPSAGLGSSGAGTVGMPPHNWAMNGGVRPVPLDMPIGGGPNSGMGQPNFNMPMNGMPPPELMGNMNGMNNMPIMNGMNNMNNMANINGMNNMNGMGNMNGGMNGMNNMNPFAGGHQGGVPNLGPPQGFNNFGGGNIDNLNNNNRGRSSGGGGGGGGWFRGNGSHNNNNNWRGGRGGNDNRPWNRNRICKSFQKGYCRNGDKCNFLHPGVNCPPL